MSFARLLNAAWMLSCQGELRAFHRATNTVAAAQRRLLSAILKRNADSDFGRRFGFHRISDPAEYQRRVPLGTYDDLAESIARVAAGEQNVLTAEPVRLLQPTSGTTTGQKLIPYTATLQAQYRRCVSAWIGDLFRRRPRVRRGRQYWSISPALDRPRTTAGGVRIGFDDDAAYLGRFQQFAARRLFAVPGDVARIKEIDAFRLATLRHLIAAEDLSLVSVWSPTFLLALFDALPSAGERLAHELSGFLPQRRTYIIRRVANRGELAADMISELWPRLALVSCWTDAASAGPASVLRGRLPNIEIQPKGLLATEGCVSFPLVGVDGAALAIRSTFLEFLPVDESEGTLASDQCCLAHELQLGRRYAVVITTGGGLYRYQLGDVIEVVGTFRQCPLVRFVGRLGAASDLVGEKLAEPFVRQAIEAVFEKHYLRPRFMLLAPSATSPAGYRLYVQLEREAAIDERQLAGDVERSLRANPHYEYAVRLGQLASVRVVVLDAHGESAWSVYERTCVSLGQKLGNIKPTVLDARCDWETVFAPLVVANADAVQRS
jgi:hypothetical protein